MSNSEPRHAPPCHRTAAERDPCRPSLSPILHTTQAMSNDGKQLAGAAKTSFIKKCCEDAAVSKDGKPLSGAAKASYVKKCVAGG